MATSEGGDATAPAITEDLYVLLEVERTASEAEIKASYRKLALKYHPDRNRGTPGAEERFKKLAQAYAILSDPNQRRFYDLSSKDGNNGGSAAFQAMQPIDVNEMNGFGRMLGYLSPLARLFCVTITIPERIDGGARYKDMVIFDTSDCVDLQTGMGGSNVKDLTIGAEVSGKVDKQEGHFFRLRITEPSECGYVVTCRSIAKNKFKLILFDQDGAVRSVQESETKAKYTSADMFLTKMEIMNMDDAWKMLSEQEQTLPEAFSRLKTLERIQTPSLEPGTHLFCVYGDNWFSSLQYTIQCLPIEHDFVESIQHVEQDLLRTKLELDAYQAEFVKAQKAFEEAMAKVDGLDRRTKGLLTTRACAYEDFFQVAALPYKHLNKKNHPEETSTFASLWSRFSVLPTPPPSNGPKRDEF